MDPSPILRFGVFEVDVRAGELRKNGAKIRLQQQPFQVLLALLSRSGDVVTREELRQQLWSADTFVDFDHSLNAAIKRLRDALGETADTPVFIETLPRRGYRFLLPIVTINGEATEAGILRQGPPALRLRWYVALPPLLLIGALIAGVIYLGQRQSRVFSGGSGSNPPPRVLPLTSDPGAEFDPSFSPDGKQVAFVKWDGNASWTGDIYVKLIGGDQPLRLTHGSGWACCSAWSPDGRYVAYGRCDGDQRGLYLVPALGGPERKLPGLACWGTSWSPEGGVIAVTQHDPPDSPWAVFLLDVHDLQLHRLTSPPPRFIGDRHPVFSPDGKTVAFVRASSSAVMDIYLMPVAGGEPRRLTFDTRQIYSLAWAADGRSLVFSSSRPGGGTLWRVSVAGGAPELLSLGGAVAEGLSVSRLGNRLAYTQGFLHPNIWQMELESLHSAGAPRPLIASSAGQGGPQFSPDGKRVTFYSKRSGSSEIWISDADGSNLIQLTSLGVLSGTPRWSPDGKFIAFDSRTANHGQIFVIPAGGGAPRRMTSGDFESLAPSWSRDGKWIYFTSNRSGLWNLWKIATDGTQSIQATRQGGSAAFESLDGRELYYVKDNDRGIWKRSMENGEERRISEVAVNWGQWAVSSNGIYYVDTTGPKPTIEFYNFADHKVSRIATLAKPLPPEESGFAVSPDGRRILYLQVESETDIMLVENFR